MNITELFKEYTSKGFEFAISPDKYDDSIMVIEASWSDGFIKGCRCEVYRGDNPDHALAACDLYFGSIS